MPSALAVTAVLLAATGVAPPEPAAPAGGPQLRLELPGPSAPVGLALDSLVLVQGGGQPALDGGDAAARGEQRASTLRWWGRTLRWSTAAALVATSTLGTMAAMNQPTAFGDGRCLTGDPVLGTYGCDRGLSTLHGSAGILSVTLYTANGVLALAAPESRGQVSEAAQPWHRALTWVHLGGMVIQPVMGLVAAFPQVIGKSTSVPTDPFPRNLRTAHVFVGYVTTAAFLATVVMER